MEQWELVDELINCEAVGKQGTKTRPDVPPLTRIYSCSKLEHKKNVLREKGCIRLGNDRTCSLLWSVFTKLYV